MEFAFILDPFVSLKAYKDTSVAMMRALDKRGHALFALEQQEMFWQSGRTLGMVRPLKLNADEHDWFAVGTDSVRPLETFSAVLMRKDPPFDMEYVYSTYLLEAAEAGGARVFNRPRALRDYNEKMAIARFPEFIVPTLVSRDPLLLHAFIDEHEDTILKPLDGMGGASVFRVRKNDPNRNVIVEAVGQNGARTVMAQRFIPEITRGDKRVLVVGGKPFGHCLARIPKAGETRGNLAAGGKGVAQPISARDREIGEIVGAEAARAGIVFAGLDVIGDFLTEINVTSPTCIVEIAQQTGRNAARDLIDALER
jgi:glutathione synthase